MKKIILLPIVGGTIAGLILGLSWQDLNIGAYGFIGFFVLILFIQLVNRRIEGG